MSETPNAVARRGDLVVIHLCRRAWKAGEPLEDDEFRLGQVTSAQRDALAAYVLRRLCEAWNPRRPPIGRQ